MRLAIILCLPLIFVLGCDSSLLVPTTTCQDSTGFNLNSNHPKASAIQAAMDRYVGLGLPGVNVLIEDEDGMWMGSAGFADLENQIPMQNCHVNKLGSTTKMMVGAVTWLLIQEGKLGLDDLMATHIPDIAEKITHGDKITVGMLLNHTAGVADYATGVAFNVDLLNEPDQSWTAKRIVNAIANRPANGLPGEGAYYSNSHTVLLGLVLEAVTGRSHRTLVQERIFDRLGMENSIYYDFEAPFPFPQLAQGYIDVYNDGKGIQNVTEYNTGNFGATGVYATVGDMYIFLNALLKEKSLITPENLDFILSNTLPRIGDSIQMISRTSFGGINDEHGYVLDRFQGEYHAYGHSGADFGYSSNLNFFPHNNSILAATYNYGIALDTEVGKLQQALREELVVIMVE